MVKEKENITENGIKSAIELALEDKIPTTARGRAEANGRTIEMIELPRKEDTDDLSYQREIEYTKIYRELEQIIKTAYVGADEKEIECVYLILEQLQEASRLARDSRF